MHRRAEQLGVDGSIRPVSRGGVAAKRARETTGPEPGADDVPLLADRGAKDPSTTPCTSVFGRAKPWRGRHCPIHG
jgi:hypothetical protein